MKFIRASPTVATVPFIKQVLIMSHSGPLQADRQTDRKWSIWAHHAWAQNGFLIFINKAMVSWFPGWRLDRCNENTPVRKIKVGTKFFYFPNRPTGPNWLVKNPPSRESTDQGLIILKDSFLILVIQPHPITFRILLPILENRSMINPKWRSLNFFKWFNKSENE